MARITVSLEASPPAPAAGMLVVYAKPSGGLWCKDEFGVERQLDLEINDSGTGTRDLWSASKIISALATSGGNYKAGVTPLGAQDGINDTFTLPGGEKYRVDSLSVYLNGQEYNPDNISKLIPPYVSFQIINGDNLPNTVNGDVFYISYMIDNA
jgi:hypothetical protein